MDMCIVYVLAILILLVLIKSARLCSCLEVNLYEILGRDKQGFCNAVNWK